MRKKFFQASFLLITLMIWSSFLGSTWGVEHSGGTDVVVADDSEWRLIVDGAVDRTLNLTLSELAAMPKTTVNADLYCYSSLVTNGEWVGVRPSVLLEEAGLQSDTSALTFLASDGYTISVDIQTALQENVIIAYELNSQPLTEVLRLVIPLANGDRWIAWITQITVNTGSFSAANPRAFRPPELPQPSSTPEPMHPTEPDDQPPAPEDIPQPQDPDNSTVQQPELTISNQPLDYSYAVLAVMMVVVASATGYLYLKHKKNKSVEYQMDYGERNDSTISAKSKIYHTNK